MVMEIKNMVRAIPTRLKITLILLLVQRIYKIILLENIKLSKNIPTGYFINKYYFFFNYGKITFF